MKYYEISTETREVVTYRVHWNNWSEHRVFMQLYPELTRYQKRIVSDNDNGMRHSEFEDPPIDITRAGIVTKEYMKLQHNSEEIRVHTVRFASRRDYLDFSKTGIDSWEWTVDKEEDGSVSVKYIDERDGLSNFRTKLIDYLKKKHGVNS